MSLEKSKELIQLNLLKIISGAQTGADRAALDFAIENNIPHFGWVPKGRIAEDGKIPSKYNVQETSRSNYNQRTEANILSSDGTLIISYGDLKGGSLYTKKYAEDNNKPVLYIDLSLNLLYQATIKIKQWLIINDIHVLNVAGPRQSKNPYIYDKVILILTSVFIS